MPQCFGCFHTAAPFLPHITPEGAKLMAQNLVEEVIALFS
jgi:hypothetical protein